MQAGLGAVCTATTAPPFRTRVQEFQSRPNLTRDCMLRLKPRVKRCPRQQTGSRERGQDARKGTWPPRRVRRRVRDRECFVTGSCWLSIFLLPDLAVVAQSRLEECPSSNRQVNGWGRGHPLSPSVPLSGSLLAPRRGPAPACRHFSAAIGQSLSGLGRTRARRQAKRKHLKLSSV